MSRGLIGVDGVWLRRFWEYGPLVLDSQKYRALVYDVDLNLSEQEFEVLDFLVRGETDATIENLCKYVWALGEEIDSQKEIAVAIEGLTDKLNAAGKGIVWIDTSPDKRIVLHLKGKRVL